MSSASTTASEPDPGDSPPTHYPPTGHAHPHRVQFYDDERLLYRRVVGYLAEGLAQGENAVVIATPEHQVGFGDGLEAKGWDVVGLRRGGRLLLLDAAETLNRFMDGDHPDWDRFRSVIEPVLDACNAGPAGAAVGVRAYGEMVDVLWRGGCPTGAIRLEGLWNDLARRRSFQLLCAYHMGNFEQQDDGDGFDRICGVHSHVAPTGGHDERATPESLLRRVGMLEQRARALQTEVAHRRRLEEALRLGLAERQRIEAALRESEQRLRQQNEELSRTVRFSETFVGILGHDLRNPLSAITTAASLLMRRAESDKVRNPCLRILNSGQRMARMIDQLLDFTRIRLGQGLPVDPRPVSLQAVCRQALEEVDEPGGTGRVEVACSGDLVGAWDGDRLCQLVGHLVGNALTHGEPGRVHLSLDGHDPGCVVLQLHNLGEIPADMVRVIFEPFRATADRKPAHSSGLGLGLYISQQIVLAHGGRIEVTSSREAGTRFIISLPRVSKNVEVNLTVGA